MSRTVLARSLYELWTKANNYKEFYEELQNCEKSQSIEFRNSSFRILVEAFGRKLSTKMKVEKIEKLSFLPFEGKINLNNPQNSYQLFEYYGENSNEVPLEPYQILFGHWIVDSQRKRMSVLSLKQRKFIANTSMEPTLSLLMANIAKISDCDLVLDPFVGSGSLLVAAAYCGAYVFGTDIDYKLIHGLTKPSRCGAKQRDTDESILSNLKQYNLQSKYLDIIVADASQPLWRSKPLFKFDAIITDPPYGKRESRERIGSEKQYKIPENLISGHIPSKVEYNLDDIFKDLLNFSALHLKIGGRLVFWLPFDKLNSNFDITKQSHSCLNIIAMSEQQLSQYVSRVLIAFEKFKEVNELSENCEHSVQLQQINYELNHINLQ
jgi:tRNA (guanine10-N2)-methyltransferase